MSLAFWITIGCLYLIPLVKFVASWSRKGLGLFFKGKSGPLYLHQTQPHLLPKIKNNVTLALGEVEYYLSPFRHYLVGWPLTLVLVYRIFMFVIHRQDFMSMQDLACFVTLIGLNFWTQTQKINSNLRFVEFLRQKRRLHPNDFFMLFKRDLAWGGACLERYVDLREVTPFEADFREKGRHDQSLWILFKAGVDTTYVTYFVLNALKKLGPAYAREIADVVGSLWGKRMLALAKNQLKVQGVEKLAGRSGKFLLIFNHKSSLDFILTFFALSEITVGQRTLKPRFIVAKDHFKDNPLLYRVLGIGRAVEIIDMVFIERKDRQKSFENLKQAAKSLVEKDIDIAIYPQGTRAMGNFDRAGKRRDAGYYTTVSHREPAKPLSHLKKGTAYLIVDTLVEMQSQKYEEPLHLVFIGIKGTANTLPRGSFKVQTENLVQFNIGDVVSLSPDMVQEILPAPADLPAENENLSEDKKIQFIEKMNFFIDEKLTEAMGLHSSLKRRFLTDLKGAFRFEEDKIETISRGLDQAARLQPAVYQIIDRVYSLPPQEWNAYLSQLCQLFQGRVEPDRFLPILEDVSEKLVA